jgi:branched-chain amino acid transport system substrate-binding protein
MRKIALALAIVGWLGSWADTASAETQYDPGVTDTAIKIGHSLPMSGPASATAAVGFAEAAYFDKINAEGGINGRKIDLIALDDAYNPAKTVEQTRKLVEQEGVFLIFATQGTPGNVAIQKYLTSQKVPQIFLGSGASRWNDPAHFPWTVPGLPSYVAEARIFAKYILATKSDAKIAILYQNDDFGRDYLRGVKEGLGDKADKMLVGVQSYEATDPTVSSQVISLQASGADAFVIGAIPVPAAQAIHKAFDLGWHPTIFSTYIANSVATTLKAAGFEQSTGVMSTFFARDPTDPQWRDDPVMKDYQAWLKTYAASLNPVDQQNATGYTLAQLLVEVLKRCGDKLTRANVIEQATHLTDLSLPMLLPGVTITLTPTGYNLYHRLQLERFDGQHYVPVGPPIAG